MFPLYPTWTAGVAGTPQSAARRILLALMVAAFGTASAVLAEELQPVVHQVEIKGFAFMPERIEVHAGDTVEFTNRDFAPHTVTEDGLGWDTGALKYGASGRIVLTEAGMLAYHCAYHPQMNGAVVILPAEGGGH